MADVKLPEAPKAPELPVTPEVKDSGKPVAKLPAIRVTITGKYELWHDPQKVRITENPTTVFKDSWITSNIEAGVLREVE